MKQIQREYRSIFNEVMKSGDPIIILNNNKPEVVILEINKYQDLQEKAEKYEQEMAKLAILNYQKEKNAKKLKKLSSLADLSHGN